MGFWFENKPFGNPVSVACCFLSRDIAQRRNHCSFKKSLSSTICMFTYVCQNHVEKLAFVDTLSSSPQQIQAGVYQKVLSSSSSAFEKSVLFFQRVTRFWRVLAYWGIVNFGSSFKITVAQMFMPTFYHSTRYLSIVTKHWLGNILGDLTIWMPGHTRSLHA
jgi:hypothetical protein